MKKNSFMTVLMVSILLGSLLSACGKKDQSTEASQNQAISENANPDSQFLGEAVDAFFQGFADAIGRAIQEAFDEALVTHPMAQTLPPNSILVARRALTLEDEEYEDYSLFIEKGRVTPGEQFPQTTQEMLARPTPACLLQSENEHVARGTRIVVKNVVGIHPDYVEGDATKLDIAIVTAKQGDSYSFVCWKKKSNDEDRMTVGDLRRALGGLFRVRPKRR